MQDSFAWTRVGLPLIAVVLSASTASAARVEGFFERMEAEADRYVLVLQDGGRYYVAPKFYANHKKVIGPGALKKGEKVTFDADAKRFLTKVYVEQAARTSGRTLRLGVFDRYDSELKLIWLTDKSNYAVRQDPPLERKKLATLLTFQRGQRIQLMIQDDKVVDLARGAKRGEEENAEVRKILNKSHPGDAPVQLKLRNDPSFKTYKLIVIRATEIVVSPQLPNSTEYKGRVTMRRDRLAEIVNPAADERIEEDGGEEGGEKKKDPFEAESVQVGDMVGVGFVTGQLIQLNEETYTLRSWRNGRWEALPQPQPRKGAKGVRHVKLVNQQQTRLENGELELSVERSLKLQRGGLVFDVTLVHTSKDLILVDLQLRFHLSTNPCMEPKQKPDRSVSRTMTVPMFAGQRETLHHEISDEAYKDGRVEVVLFPRNQVSISSKQARKHLIHAIANNESVEALGGVYRAAAVNGDNDICRFMTARALELRNQIERGKNDPVAKAHELELRKGLDAYGPKAAQLILNELFGLDRQLKSWGMRGGQIVQVPLPAKERAQSYKRKLIALLAVLKSGLDKDVGGERLFDLYLRRAEDFKEDIIRAYQRKPGDAVASLLHVAVDVKDRERAEKATILMRELGEPILPALFNELSKKGIDPSPFRELLRKGDSQPQEIVKAVVDKLVARAYEQIQSELSAAVEEASNQRANKEFDAALTTLRGVLTREPAHIAAKKLLPEVLIDSAREMRAAGQKGKAALALQEAADLLKGPDQAKATTPLGDMLVEATKEELTSLVVKAAPHGAAESLKPVQQGALFTGRDLPESELQDWLEVDLEDGKKGYIRKALVAPAEEGKYRVTQVEVPYMVLEAQLEKARKFAPASAPRANEILGRLSAREGERRYKAGDFKNALAYFNVAAEHAPTDPRLALRWKCWTKANTAPLVGVGAAVAFVVALVVMQLFSRPKKIKFSGEYRHYGADRSRRERDLDVEE